MNELDGINSSPPSWQTAAILSPFAIIIPDATTNPFVTQGCRIITI